MFSLDFPHTNWNQADTIDSPFGTGSRVDFFEKERRVSFWQLMNRPKEGVDSAAGLVGMGAALESA